MKSLVETQNISNGSNIISIFKAIVTSFILTLILLFIFSIILTYTSMGENSIPSVIIIITVISILIGGSIAGATIKKNGIIYGGIIGLIYILSLYLISSIVNTGFSVNIYSTIMIILSIIAGMIGGIVGVNIKK